MGTGNPPENLATSGMELTEK
ncbi:hypothetical protein LINGRAPRIM_LOCUS3425 [Linum grandiflorum]